MQASWDCTMEELNIEEFEKKEEIVFFKEEILLSSTLEAKPSISSISTVKYHGLPNQMLFADPTNCYWRTCI